MINPVSPLFVIVALLLALATVKALSWKFEPPKATGRFATIDGLRGYLAFFVFLHHSSVWYFYLHTGVWQAPPSKLFNHLGQSSVTLFFMITGFLFFTRIIDGKARGIDWLKLYVARLMRLLPLYLFAMALLFTTVAVISRGVAIDPPSTIAIAVLRWLGFTIAGAPDINGVGAAGIVAGVTWTLTYEWLFYLCLPLLSAAIGAVPSIPVLIIGLLGIMCGVVIHAAPVYLTAFVGGIAAAILVRQQGFRRLAATRIASVVVIAALLLVVTLFPTAYSRYPLLLLSLSFALIAGGATLFGVLSHPLSRMFGEMTYSIYLLHGMFLFSLFNFVIGKHSAGMLSPTSYCMLITLIVPVLLLICFTTFNLIEKPAMQRTEGVVRWLRATWLPGRITAKDVA